MKFSNVNLGQWIFCTIFIIVADPLFVFCLPFDLENTTDSSSAQHISKIDEENVENDTSGTIVLPLTHVELDDWWS